MGLGKKRVLFICTQNACRSQMAEALLRLRFEDDYEVHSAGTEPSRVNPWAIRVMAELGVDISGQISEHVDRYLGQTFDAVVTTCDSANETCPVFPGAKTTIHHGFDNPASAAGSDAVILTAFRRARDEIDHWIRTTFDPTSAAL
jgi:arsenate reductase